MFRSDSPAPSRSSYNTLYAKLGVPPDASTKAIRAAYGVLEQVYRPGGAYIDDAMHLGFTEIARAASILGNSSTRRLYDRGYIDEFGKRTEAGLAQRARTRKAAFASLLFAAGLAGLAMLVFGGPTDEPSKIASNAGAAADLWSLPSPPEPATRLPEQTQATVSNEKPSLSAAEAPAPLQGDARDDITPEKVAGQALASGPVFESAQKPGPRAVAPAPGSPALDAAPLKPGARGPDRPEGRRMARLSRTAPQMVQSYIWFGGPAPAWTPVRSSKTLRTAHCLACLTDHRADCSRACP